MAKKAKAPVRNSGSALVSTAVNLATSVIADAALDATKTIASAAADAKEALSSAAADASAVLKQSATQALVELPPIREDIREIRSGQLGLVTSITSVVTELMATRDKIEQTRFDGLSQRFDKIEAHIEEQNKRIGKAETHIVRQNLVLFGIGGPLTLLVCGYILNNFFTKGWLSKLFT